MSNRFRHVYLRENGANNDLSASKSKVSYSTREGIYLSYSIVLCVVLAKKGEKKGRRKKTAELILENFVRSLAIHSPFLYFMPSWNITKFEKQFTRTN